MSIRTEKKLAEFGRWWEYNTKSSDDTDALAWKLPENMLKRTELLAKGMDSLAHIYIDLCEDIKVLEGRGTIGRNVNKIVTPDNVLRRN